MQIKVSLKRTQIGTKKTKYKKIAQKQREANRRRQKVEIKTEQKQRQQIYEKKNTYQISIAENVLYFLFACEAYNLSIFHCPAAKELPAAKEKKAEN